MTRRGDRPESKRTDNDGGTLTERFDIARAGIGDRVLELRIAAIEFAGA
jgi:hypothetical protein